MQLNALVVAKNVVQFARQNIEKVQNCNLKGIQELLVTT